MPSNLTFVNPVNELLAQLDQEPKLETAIELSKHILQLADITDLPTAEDIALTRLKLPSAERYDHWFQPHPYFKSDRACFELIDSATTLVQAKLYWLQKRSRQFIAAGVHFSPNFEDEDFTRTERYKVGIDFFLSPNGKSLQVVLSNRGNLRIVELSKKLNNTQVEIFTKWQGVGQLTAQEAIHTTLWESFKLKTVNEKFYAEIANNFILLFQHLRSIDKDEEESKLFASRLLGRLLFCWFLRKKGIIDESVGYFNAKGANATEYYRQSLEQLFFLTLNTPIDERGVLNHSDPKTPYLNGGLFEPHDNDWFKDETLTFPEGFFVNLYSHFEEFNFTTDESSPEYEQIAIDPEMLGRVFESLLATQIDETGQQARKAKGAFYTPREIVSYMCRESLRNYLYGAVKEGEDIRSSINGLLDIPDSEWAKAGTNSKRDTIKSYRTDIIGALDAVTVLDPACGSGAFPMGMLQLCMKTYERLESRFDPYKTKLQVIQNNIFGVDIEPMAVEIARLRAWLSLIVDEEDSSNVEPLPNLDFKFVCANSLIPLNKELGLFSDGQLHQKLKDIRTKYFNARKPHTKKAIQAEYYKLTKSEQTALIADDNRTVQLKSFDPFKNAKPAGFFDPDQMFGIDQGFDIVIANPPYVSVKGLSTQVKSQLASHFETAQGRFNLFTLFIEKGLVLLSPGSTMAYIIPEGLYSHIEYRHVRQYLLQNSDINLINQFSARVFEASVDTTIISVSKRAHQAGNSFNVYRDLRDVTMKLDQSEFSNLPYCLFPVNLQAKSASIITRLLNGGYEPLCKLVEIQQGIIYSGLPREEIFSNEKINASYKPVLDGRDILKWHINWDEKLSNKYIEYSDKLHRARDERLFTAKEKIVLPRRSLRISCAYDNQQYYALNTAYVCLPKTQEWNLKYIMACLNSKLINYLYSNLFLGWQITIPALDSIPIVQSDRSTQSQLAALVDEASIHARVGDITALKKVEQQIDQAVYKLYNLTSEEIALVESKY